MKSSVVRFLPAFMIAILIAAVFGKSLFPPANRIIMGGDISGAYFYWKGYLKRSFLAGEIPFWNPYNFSGTPFLAHPNINIFYPANWLFIILPLNLSFSLYFYLHIVWAGFGMYLLGRHYTDKWGAFAAALIFSLSGYFAARVYSGHLEYVDSAAWIPFVFARFLKVLDKTSAKNSLILLVSLTLMLLSGNELFLLFFFEMVAFYLVFHLLEGNKFLLRLKKAGLMIIIFLFSIGLAGVGILPRLEFISQSIRSAGIPYEIAAAGSLPLHGLRLFADPYFFGSPFPENYSYSGPWPNMFEFTYYVGIIPLIFIAAFIMSKLIGLAVKKSVGINVNKDFLYYLFLIAFFIFISLGAFAGLNLHWLLWKFTPLYKGIRFPVRHLFVAAVAACVVAGMLIGSIRKNSLKAILIIAAVADLFLFSKPFYRTVDLPTNSFDQKLIKLLQEEKEPVRLLPDFPVISQVRRDLDFGAATTYGIHSTSDYNSMVLNRYYRFIDILNNSPSSSLSFYNVEIPPPNPNSPFLDFLNVKYLLSDKNIGPVPDNSSGKFIKLMENERFILFENRSYLPRFFLVSQTETYGTEIEIEKALRQKQPDLSKVVYIQENSPTAPTVSTDCPDQTGKEVTITEYGINKIKLNIESPCDLYLAESEVNYPGWKAKIDGSDTKIYPSNLAFRSIFIPKGHHSVEYIYVPDIYYYGMLISVISLIALLVLYRKYKRKYEN